MIRYIDIGDQIMEDSSQFAWFDTVIDRFLMFNDSHTWETWGEFEDDFSAAGGEDSYTIQKHQLARFKRLYPLNLRRDNPLEKELVIEEE